MNTGDMCLSPGSVLEWSGDVMAWFQYIFFAYLGCPYCHPLNAKFVFFKSMSVCKFWIALGFSDSPCLCRKTSGGRKGVGPTTMEVIRKENIVVL